MMNAWTNMPQSSSDHLVAKASRWSCKGHCSFMRSFTDAFQSSLATHCNFFLDENPSGDKVQVTSGEGPASLHDFVHVWFS